LTPFETSSSFPFQAEAIQEAEISEGERATVPNMPCDSKQSPAKLKVSGMFKSKEFLVVADSSIWPENA
jgi:hypothetical protein